MLNFLLNWKDVDMSLYSYHNELYVKTILLWKNWGKPLILMNNVAYLATKTIVDIAE